MYEVVQTGTGQRADLSPRHVAAKTGTSQDWRDAWFVGYTADFVGGVWLGNDDNAPMSRVVGGSLPATIWKTYMIDAHRRIAVRPLPGIYDGYGSDDDYYGEAPTRDDPWVDRGGNDAPPVDDDRGIIEDFFDSLFGDSDQQRSAPPPRSSPGFGPRN